MDIVLEFTDRLVLDQLYATLLPLGSNALDFLKSNSTLTSYEVGSVPTTNGWTYKPASQYVSIGPGEAAYMSSWRRDDPLRQFISLYLITWIFGGLVYFFFATLSFLFIFDRNTLKHPRFLKNQITLEIVQTLWSLPIMALFTAPIFWIEVQGYSRMYDATADGPGLWYNFAQFPFFIMFTDWWIYWIHRGLHHPWVYKHLHKPHHKWIMPTPYASHAFHPIDGFAQSVPYHVFPFLFPLQKWAYVVLFVFINIWTILIHDGEYLTNHPVINGAACHSIHHMEFTGNFGQFTTLPDRFGLTYRKPTDEMFVRTEVRVVKSEVAADKEARGEKDFKQE